MGKGRLKYFLPKLGAIIALLKKYFPVLICLAVCLYENSPNEGTVKFLAKFGAIFSSLENRGTRGRIQSRDIKITPPLSTVRNIPAGSPLAGSAICCCREQLLPLPPDI